MRALNGQGRVQALAGDELADALGDIGVPLGDWPSPQRLPACTVACDCPRLGCSDLAGLRTFPWAPPLLGAGHKSGPVDDGSLMEPAPDLAARVGRDHLEAVELALHP